MGASSQVNNQGRTREGTKWQQAQRRHASIILQHPGRGHGMTSSLQRPAMVHRTSLRAGGRILADFGCAWSNLGLPQTEFWLPHFQYVAAFPENSERSHPHQDFSARPSHCPPFATFSLTLYRLLLLILLCVFGDRLSPLSLR